MIVLVDREGYKFLAKHPNAEAMADLANLQYPHIFVSVVHAQDEVFLANYTDVELQALYFSVVGKYSTYTGHSLRAVLMELVSRMPVMRLNPVELRAQVACIPEGEDDAYTYVKGRLKPILTPLIDLPTKGLTCDPAPNEAEIAGYKSEAVWMLFPDTPRVAAAPVNDSPLARDKPARDKPVSSPRKPGARATIWEVANAMWEAAGKPADLPTLLPLRKKMMDELEASHDIKRTTSSTALGDWQKQVLAG